MAAPPEDQAAARPDRTSAAAVWREAAAGSHASSGVARVRRLRGFVVGKSVIRTYKPCKARGASSLLSASRRLALAPGRGASSLRLGPDGETPPLSSPQTPLSREHAQLPARAAFDHTAVHASARAGAAQAGSPADIWRFTKDAVVVDDEAIGALLLEVVAQQQAAPEAEGSTGADAA